MMRKASTMSEQDQAGAKEETEVLTIAEGEPHPADLLANLMRAESEKAASANEPKESGQSATARPVDPRQEENIAAAARALAAQPTSAEAQDPNALQRTLVSIRNALPLLQKLLPLLDGNILGAVMGMLAHSPPPQPPPPPPPAALAKTVDLSPVEESLTELKKQNRELRGQVATQDAAIKHLAEQLEQVREATERNTHEQEDLVDELKVSGKRMNLVAFLAFALLAASIAMNVVLYLQIHRLLP
jgi:hypothetical protein